MTPNEREQYREYVQRWKHVGPKLEAIRRQELRDYRHEENVSIIDSLMQMGCDLAQPRTTSGLVELQRLLAKLKR